MHQLVTTSVFQLFGVKHDVYGVYTAFFIEKTVACGGLGDQNLDLSNIQSHVISFKNTDKTTLDNKLLFMCS